MASISGTCVGCHAPFGRNGELAAIPDASKIAFDPTHHRVWRICASCGEWNLLGAEAAGAALPELEARFATAPKTPGDTGFAPAHVGKTLELLRIGGTEVQEQDDVAALKRRRQVDRSMMALTALIGLGGVFMLANAVWLFQHHALVMSAALYLYVFSLGAVMRRVVQIRHRIAVTRGSLLLYSVSVVIGAALLLQGPYWFWPLLLLFVGNAIAAFMLAPRALVTVDLSDGTALRLLSDDALRHVSLSWNPGTDDLFLHDLPDGSLLSGADALAVLRQLLLWRPGTGMPRPAQTEDAYTLLRSTGGLRGLLHALDGFRRDSDGRVVVAELPLVYRLALHLALPDAGASGGPDHRLRRKAADAALIAGEAEALDAGNTE